MRIRICPSKVQLKGLCVFAYANLKYNSSATIVMLRAYESLLACAHQIATCIADYVYVASNFVLFFILRMYLCLLCLQELT